MPAWERRFRAPVSYLPEWSPHAPGAVVYTSNESGSWQAHAWDASTGERRQVTEDPVGVIDATATLDGRGVVWFQDETGSEAGRWIVQAFGGGETHPFLGFPHGWSEGLAQAPGIVAAGISTGDGFAVHVSLDGASPNDVPIVGVGPDRQRGPGWIPARRALCGRFPALSRACRAR